MNKEYYIMDLIFRSMSRAAGVEIPSGKHLPWEKLEQQKPEPADKGSRATAAPPKTLQLLISRLLAFLGNRLIRASDALGTQ